MSTTKNLIGGVTIFNFDVKFSEDVRTRRANRNVSIGQINLDWLSNDSTERDELHSFFVTSHLAGRGAQCIIDSNDRSMIEPAQLYGIGSHTAGVCTAELVHTKIKQNMMSSSSSLSSVARMHGMMDIENSRKPSSRTRRVEVAGTGSCMSRRIDVSLDGEHQLRSMSFFASAQALCQTGGRAVGRTEGRVSRPRPRSLLYRGTQQATRPSTLQ